VSGLRQQTRLLGIALCLVAVTAMVYWPLSRATLISYDDPEYITWNIDIQHGLTLDALKWAFTTGYTGNWHPLTWVSYLFDYQCFGGTPGAMHLTNVALHILNSLLVLWLLWRITGALWRSAFVAAVFALHPLHVESVAWTCERKDVLSTFFGLLAIWAYAAYVRAKAPVGAVGAELRLQGARSKGAASDAAPRRHHPSPFYLTSLLFFACSLMSKPMLVTLPLVLVLLDFWPLNRFRKTQAPFRAARPILVEKLPFLALTVADSIVTFLAQKAGGAIVSADTLTLGRRAANALMAYLHYLRDAFWPAHLSICYPAAGVWPVWQPVLAFGLLIALSALVLRQRRQAYLVTGWFWFLGTLVPVIGLVQTGAQTIADRFMYFPLAGLAICVAWGAVDLFRSRPAAKPILVLAALACIGACAGLTARQVSFWQDDLAVFGRAIAVNPGNSIAHYLYAMGLQKQQRYDEAAEHLKEALRLNPRNAGAHVNLAVYLGMRGDLQAALAHARTALEINPADADAHDTLAVALLQLGQRGEAEEHFRQAIRLRPSHAAARNHLAVALMQSGKWDEAIAQLREALRYEPASAEFRQNLNYAFAHSVEANRPFHEP
jgi:tetratricopeptide (TPR) repeat protein